MRARAVVLAVAIVLAPLGARAADLVVWWEKGFYPQEDEAVAEIVAAFEQETGKQVELVQPAQDEMFDKAQAALEAGQPPDFLFGTAERSLGRPVGLRGPARRPRGRPRPGPGPVRCRHRRSVHLAQRQDGPARPLRACRWAGVPTTSMSGTASWSAPASPSPTSRRSGRRSGPSGATRCSRRCARPWAATTSGASGCPCRPRLSTPRTSSCSSSSPTRRPGSTATAGFRSTIPTVRAGMIKALEAYTAIWRKGCTPPDSASWTNIDNNKAFLAQTVVMTPNTTLSIPAALRTARPDDYYKNAATIDWPDGANGQPLVIDGVIVSRRGLQGRRKSCARRATSSASSPRKAGSPTG